MTSNNNVLGSPSRNGAEWKKAWAAISRLAAARQASLREASTHSDAPPYEAGDEFAAPNLAATFDETSPLDSAEYARAIAEIEQASAALRRAEPALEAWQPEPATTASEPRKSRSVWILIGGIWISTVSVFAGAIGAILYLLG